LSSEDLQAAQNRPTAKSFKENPRRPSAAGFDHIGKAIHEVEGAIRFVEARS
jgi:hypothetical protein